MCVYVWERERKRDCVSMFEREWESERDCVCVLERERERGKTVSVFKRELAYICIWERKTMKLNVCLRERERD